MTNYPKLEDVLQAAREAVADNFHDGIVTANGWPETRERMAMGDSIAVAMANKVMELLLVSSDAVQAAGIPALIVSVPCCSPSIQVVQGTSLKAKC